MRALIQRTFGSLADDGVASVETVPIPTAKPQWVVVKVLAAAANPADYKLARGDFGAFGRVLGITVPRGIGLDVCGVITEVGPGGCGRLRVGDRVWSMGAVTKGASGGSFAEYFALPEDAVYHAPANISAVDAAALPLASITAIQALRRAGCGAGKRVLVIGGSGGTGTAAIQIAKAMGAAHVTAVCGAGAALCRELGADATLDYRSGDWASLHLTQEGAAKFDCVLDTVGGPEEYHRAVRVMAAASSRYVTIIGNHPDESFSAGMLLRYTSWLAAQALKYAVGAAPFYANATADAYAAADFRQIALWVESGRLRAVLDAEAPPCELETGALRRLFARLMSHRTKGKLVCAVAAAHAPSPAVPVKSPPQAAAAAAR